MSASVVSKSQIDVLVAAGAHVVGDEHTPEHLSVIGQNLLDECVRSVSYRYSDDDLGNLPGTYDSETIPGTTETLELGQWLTPYTYRAPAEPINRETVANVIGSYNYQSCEHPEWEDSWAHLYCVGLRAQLARLPEAPAPERAPAPDPEEFRQMYGDLSRDETIRRIRTALKRRSGKAWSVTGGRGTGYGWIHIQSPPKRRVGWGYMTEEDQQELAQLLGKDRPVHFQGESIAASSEYRREYIDRAEGRTPSTHGTPYWD